MPRPSTDCNGTLSNTSLSMLSSTTAAVLWPFDWLFFCSGNFLERRGAVKKIVWYLLSRETLSSHSFCSPRIHFAALRKHAGSGAHKPSDMPARAEKPSKIEAPESTAASLRGDSEEQELADDLEELEIKSSGTAS